MKKKYPPPTIEKYEVALQEIICLSIDSYDNTGETITGEEALSKDNNVWDENTWDTWEDEDEK